MVAIGILFRLDCPIQRNVPVYLIMSGIISIVMLAWLIVTQLDIRYVKQLEYYVQMHKIQWFLLSMLFIWCFLGCYFVFGVAFPEENACHPVLYKFSFFSLVAQIFLFINVCALFVCGRCFCCKYCHQKEDVQESPIPADGLSSSA